MIHEGELLGGTYQVMKQIGRGGSGLVYLAYHRNLRKYVVIKRVQSGLGNLEALRAETDILKNLRHTNIPQVYDFLVRDGEVFTVMDYIEGTSFERLPAGGRRISEKIMTGMLLQLAGVLAYLHKNRPPVIHSDIKPDNLILNTQGNVCLIDFNISVSSSVANSLSGYSMHFASPEQWQRVMRMRAGDRNPPPLDARTDIYSTGALFYYLITGWYPDTRSPKGAGSGNSAGPGGTGSGSPNGSIPANVLYRDMLACGYSDALCRIIARCLEPNRNLRYADGTKLRRALRHLRRQDRKFQRYILLRTGSWILTAALIGSGIWFLSNGLRQQTVDHYVRAYRNFAEAKAIGDEQAATEAGSEILNNSEYAQLRKERPQDEVLIQQCLGDFAYEQEAYDTAQECYGKALEIAKREGLSTSRYYRDYAIALTMDGQLRRAQIILDEAKTAAGVTDENAAVSDPDLMLIQAYLLLEQEDVSGCIAQVERILSTRADADLKARACVLAANACEKTDRYGSSYGSAGYDSHSSSGADPSSRRGSGSGAGNNAGEEEAEEASEGADRDRLDWLLLATNYSGDARYQRLLAGEYWARADDSGDSTPEERRENARKALACYEKLADRQRPRLDDCIHRVMIMQYLGDYDGSIRILHTLESKWPEDYRIPMYLAFAHDAKGERGSASSYAAAALQMYEASGSSHMEDSEAIEYLRQLK